jgi:CSLREA domain-containing protein
VSRASLVGVLIGALATTVFVPSALAATFTVNGTDDAFDAGSVRNGVCDTDTVTPNNQCSLRAAIQEASDAVVNPGADTINFDPAVFTGNAATSTIVAGSPEPAINEAATVDGGDCDATAAFKPCVGFQASGGTLGLTVSGNNVEIRGLAITNGSTGVTVSGDSAKIAGNWFGLRLDETAQGNGRAVELASNVDAGNDQNTVGGETAADRNVFAHNTGDGLRISGADGNVIKGNYFGTKPDGTTAAANGAGAGGDDIEISSLGGIANLARNNIVGGTQSSAQLATPECDGPCNVIANSTDGIDLETEGGSDGSGPGPTTIRGNFIGLDRTGQTQAANTNRGIRALQTDSTNRPLTVGGLDPGDRNVISGNTQGGLLANGGTTVRNNYFSSNSGGDAAIPNGFRDAFVGTNDSPPTSTVQDNQFVGNGVSGGRLTLNGGTEAIGNTFGIGVGGQTLATGNTAIVALENFDEIGGPDPGDANTIGHVAGGNPAIMINGGNENHVRGNLIGVTGDGTAVPNSGPGIQVTNGSTNTALDNTIGGDTLAEENLISNSGADAIEIVDNDTPTAVNNSGNEVLRNRGSNNGSTANDLFIDLRTDTSGNGPGNPATGPNAGIGGPALNEPTTTQMTGTGGPTNKVRVFKTIAETNDDVRGLASEASVAGDTTWTATFSPPLPDGQCLSATQTDTLGNTSELTQPGLSIGTNPCDVTAPTTTIETGPSGTTNDPTADFGFSSESGTTFECRVDQGQFGPCTDSTGPSGSHSTTPLADGPHTFQVRATDPVGNLGTAASRSFTVDTTPPAAPPPAGTSPPASLTPAGPTGLRAAALKKCKKKHGAARAKCKKKAKLLPL